MKKTRITNQSASLRSLMKVACAGLSMMLSVVVFAGMVPMNDSEMATVDGQALFMSAQETSGSYTFYKMGLDTKLELNANIKELKLGETSTGIDIWAKNVAFGCTANASGVCVDSASATQLKPFVLTRPFIQIATKGANAATREVVGIRLGAENAAGPLSIGNFLSFSGYLSATGNITMQAQGTSNADDIAVTCGASTAPCPGPLSGTGVNSFGLDGLRSMGLDNGSACVLSICAEFKDLTIGFGAVTRSNLPIVLNGRRQTQAFIQNAQLSSAVDSIVDSMEVIRSNSLPAGLINAIKGIISGSVKTQIKTQLATGLGTTVANLETYQIPFNVENLHSADINSSLFGLSFQKEAGVQYPGYAVPMQQGWSMYLPNAFTLSVSQPTTVFVNNIASGGARAGNIVQLPIPGAGRVYDNCWGTSVFC